MDDQPDHVYIRHVTLGRFFRLVATWLGFWLMIVVLSSDTVPPMSFENPVPRQVWFGLAVAILSWVARGKSITWPKISGVTWIVLNVWVAATLIAPVLLPSWASILIASGLVVVVSDYKDLVASGRSNYLKIYRR